jgi:hypothetical protein
LGSRTAWLRLPMNTVELVIAHLRFTRANQHFVVFVEGAGQVIIVDFLCTAASTCRGVWRL